MTQPEKKKRDGATPFDQVDLQLPVETIHLKFVPWNFEARFKKMARVHQWWGVVPRDKLGYGPYIFSPLSSPLCGKQMNPKSPFHLPAN